MRGLGTITDGTVTGPHGPVPVRRYEPVSPSAPRLVWAHGGAFVSGGLDQAESHEFARALCALGVPVTTVDYRLASSPLSRALRGERPRRGAVRFPVPADEVLAVARNEQRAHGGGVLLGGASAGACLAAAGALRMAEEGAPPLGAVLVYAILHATLPPLKPAVRGALRGRRRWTHTAASFGVMNRHYAGDSLGDRFAFPGGHPLDGFPPALVLDAEHDAMRASGERFAEELREHGVEVDHEVVGGVDHAFLDRPGGPGFDSTATRVAEWARRRS